MKRKNQKIINKEKLEIIKSIEKQIYPDYMLMLDEVENYKELVYYCEGKPHLYLIEEKAYCLYTEEEIIDFASIKSLTLIELNKLLNTLKDFYKNKIIKMDCRLSTSYRLIKYLVKRNKIKIINESHYKWDEYSDEDMVYIELQIL